MLPLSLLYYDVILNQLKTIIINLLIWGSSTIFLTEQKWLLLTLEHAISTYVQDCNLN